MWFPVPEAWKYASLINAIALLSVTLLGVAQLFRANELPKGIGYRALISFYFLTTIPVFMVQILSFMGSFPGRELTIVLSGIAFILFWGSMSSLTRFSGLQDTETRQKLRTCYEIRCS